MSQLLHTTQPLSSTNSCTFVHDPSSLNTNYFTFIQTCFSNLLSYLLHSIQYLSECIKSFWLLIFPKRTPLTLTPDMCFEVLKFLSPSELYQCMQSGRFLYQVVIQYSALAPYYSPRGLQLCLKNPESYQLCLISILESLGSCSNYTVTYSIDGSLSNSSGRKVKPCLILIKDDLLQIMYHGFKLQEPRIVFSSLHLLLQTPFQNHDTNDLDDPHRFSWHDLSKVFSYFYYSEIVSPEIFRNLMSHPAIQPWCEDFKNHVVSNGSMYNKQVILNLLRNPQLFEISNEDFLRVCEGVYDLYCNEMDLLQRLWSFKKGKNLILTDFSLVGDSHQTIDILLWMNAKERKKVLPEIVKKMSVNWKKALLARSPVLFQEFSWPFFESAKKNFQHGLMLKCLTLDSKFLCDLNCHDFAMELIVFRRFLVLAKFLDWCYDFQKQENYGSRAAFVRHHVQNHMLAMLQVPNARSLLLLVLERAFPLGSFEFSNYLGGSRDYYQLSRTQKEKEGLIVLIETIHRLFPLSLRMNQNHENSEQDEVMKKAMQLENDDIRQTLVEIQKEVSSRTNSTNEKDDKEEMEETPHFIETEDQVWISTHRTLLETFDKKKVVGLRKLFFGDDWIDDQ
ncbi:hypothetical protein C9374_003289 [Naegleria lovaniensis]|uniref:F-box domain-containing protein n=1 Tax=Naegleria lovaniensis TaxID=51637 RepID=A0AA88GTE3_NAELO|nr:uncharacterized protein C9374_003289 [Naegleria lovaniensis]KAG2385474.1 hypothetical protein C9374_003289 [Naegleria lovaniensis]